MCQVTIIYSFIRKLINIGNIIPSLDSLRNLHLSQLTYNLDDTKRQQVSSMFFFLFLFWNLLTNENI